MKNVNNDGFQIFNGILMRLLQSLAACRRVYRASSLYLQAQAVFQLTFTYNTHLWNDLYNRPQAGFNPPIARECLLEFDTCSNNPSHRGWIEELKFRVGFPNQGSLEDLQLQGNARFIGALCLKLFLIRFSEMLKNKTKFKRHSLCKILKIYLKGILIHSCVLAAGAIFDEMLLQSDQIFFSEGGTFCAPLNDLCMVLQI